MPTRSAFMTEHDPTRLDEPPLAQPASAAGPGPSVPDGPGVPDGPPPPPPLSAVPTASVTGDGQARRQRKAAPWLSNRRGGWIVAAALLCAVVGLSVALALSPSGCQAPGLMEARFSRSDGCRGGGAVAVPGLVLGRWHESEFAV